MEQTTELTILMPCLNEAETLAVCISKACAFLKRENICGEILVADNGSTDGSQEIARSCGARVIDVRPKGYGAALQAGLENAAGTYVIMGDADGSYDFSNLLPFVEKLREGCDLVMGNRFAGGIEKGAMPFSHRYIGNPVLSWLGRALYRNNIRDYHCGLRGCRASAIKNLHLCSTGMEYASEMVIAAVTNGLKLTEVPTRLSRDGRSRKSHLRTIRDGCRHLRLLVAYRVKVHGK